jgi:hypothetical protein
LNLTAISSGPPWTECLRSIFRGRDMQNVLPRSRSSILILSAGIALFIVIPGQSPQSDDPIPLARAHCSCGLCGIDSVSVR